MSYILAYLQDFHKIKVINNFLFRWIMLDHGFIQIKHELLRCEDVIKAPCAQRWMLICILDRITYKHQVFDDHGEKLNLLPGQLVLTVRDFAELINVNKNDVERGLARFSKCKILRHEVRHRKTLVTVLWGTNLKTCETKSETKVRQERDTKQEDKNTRINKVSINSSNSSNIEKETCDTAASAAFEREDISLKNSKGETISITSKEIYHYFLKKYETPIIQEAIKQAKKSKNPTNSILGLLDTICERLKNEEKRERKKEKIKEPLPKKTKTNSPGIKFSMEGIK